MQRFLLGVLVLWLAALAVACSTTNSSNTGLPAWDDRGVAFTVTTDEGAGSFTPALDVKETDEGATVTITATGAEDLSSAFLHLAYNAGRYTPERVEIGEFLGSPDQVISVAVTDVRSEVPIGLVQLPDYASPVDGSGVLATVHFSAQPFVQGRNVSVASPQGPKNTVDDLAIIAQDATTATLRWTEKNVGDYDNNGEVNVSDLSPIALFYGKTVATSQDPIHASMVDGDDNGEINLADISPIGQNFQNKLTGYILYTDGGNSEQVGTGITVLRSDQEVVNNRPTEYNYLAAIGDGSAQFAVRPAATGFESAPGPASNVAQVISEPGAPQDPSGLLAESGQAIGPLKIQLTWTLSTSIDIEGYEIERKLSSELDSAYANVGEVGGTTNTFVDQTGLTDDSYDYRIRARDLTGLFSGYTAPATGTPYVFVVGVPENVTAIPDTSASVAILIEWDEPADDSAINFRVYRQGPGDLEFLPLGITPPMSGKTDWQDTGLLENQDYSYYVVSLNAGVESAPSATQTCQPSIASELDLVGISTDKKNHYTGGGEGVSTISIQTSPAADSYSWESTVGSVTGTGNVVTWAPSGNPAAQVVTITCTATKGSKSVEGSVNICLTEETIKTQYGDNGHFTDFNDKPSLLQPNAPYLAFSDYCDGDSVVLFNWWETWCPPCKAELPDFHSWVAEYNDSGFWYIGNNGDDDLAGTQAFYDQYGYPLFENYYGIDVALWTSYGFTNGIPTTILFDQDGMARLQQVGAITGGLADHWEKVICQCQGCPVE